MRDHKLTYAVFVVLSLFSILAFISSINLISAEEDVATLCCYDRWTCFCDDDCYNPPEYYNHYVTSTDSKCICDDDYGCYLESTKKKCSAVWTDYRAWGYGIVYYDCDFIGQIYDPNAETCTYDVLSNPKKCIFCGADNTTKVNSCETIYDNSSLCISSYEVNTIFPSFPNIFPFYPDYSMFSAGRFCDWAHPWNSAVDACYPGSQDTTLFCRPPCITDADCEIEGTNKTCINKRCRDKCETNADCSANQVCKDKICKDKCDNSDDCDYGQICKGEVCEDSCTYDSDCSAGQKCIDGVCKNVCTSDSDCATGQKCIDGTCRDECNTNSDCAQCQSCDDGFCNTYGDVCSSNCCSGGKICIDPSIGLCCNAGAAACGNKCCSTGQVCANPSTGLCCDAGAEICGNKCCSTGQVCKDTSKNLCCDADATICGNNCCGDGETCVDPLLGVCCKTGEVYMNTWSIQGLSCVEQTTKQCFGCACNYGFGDYLDSCSNLFTVGSCADEGKDCCYGTCFDPLTQRCCAKDECNNTVIEIDDCCKFDSPSSGPYIAYLNSTPDYNTKFKDKKEVEYHEVFDLPVKFQVIANDSGCSTEDPFTVFYTISGLTWKTPIGINDSITCNSGEICEIEVPNDKIRPGDIVTIDLYAQDKNGMNSTINSSMILIPGFDIVVDGVVPIQVLPGFDLIKNKPTMIRIYYHIESYFVTKVDGVEAEGSIGGVKMTGDSDLKKFPLVEEIVANKDNKMYNALKKGKNTVNLFSVKVKPDSGNTASITAKIDPNENFKEIISSNNVANSYENVVEVNKKVLIIFVPIEIGSWRGGYNSGDFSGVVNSGLDFFRDLYPINPDNVDFKIYPPYRPTKDFNSTTALGDLADAILPYLKMLKKQDFSSYDEVYIVGIIPRGLMKQVSGFTDVGWFSTKGVMVFEAPKSVDEAVLAHEVGHVLGLHTFLEEYTLYAPYGKLSANGWRVSLKEDGARININQNRFKKLDSIDGVGYREHIFCFMGVGGFADAWTDEEDYQYLFNYFTGN